jgi:hypothetical protein
MASPDEIESARLNMREARMALEDYERLHGVDSTLEHRSLAQEFTKASMTYLRLSASQR